jgi:hypothetical protein
MKLCYILNHKNGDKSSFRSITNYVPPIETIISISDMKYKVKKLEHEIRSINDDFDISINVILKEI